MRIPDERRNTITSYQRSLNFILLFHPIIAKVIYRITECTAHDCIYGRKSRVASPSHFTSKRARVTFCINRENLLHKVNTETARNTRERTAGRRREKTWVVQKSRAHRTRVTLSRAPRNGEFPLRFKGLKGIISRAI